MRINKIGMGICLFCLSGLVVAANNNNAVASAPQKVVQMYKVDEKGINGTVGTVQITQTKYGLLFTPDLKGLTPGHHGFHIHEFSSCMPVDNKAAGMAGTHYDPLKTGIHLGDLPELVVDADGTATYPVLAPRLHSVQEMAGHSVMVHVGHDNFGDNAGGDRMVCGVIE
jgi:Cu-Zn family superoxide dismutase